MIRERIFSKIVTMTEHAAERDLVADRVPITARPCHPDFEEQSLIEPVAHDTEIRR